MAAGEPGEKRGTTKTLFGYIIYILYTYIMAAQIERGKSVILCVLYMEIRIPHMCMCMRTCIHHVHGLDTYMHYQHSYMCMLALLLMCVH